MKPRTLCKTSQLILACSPNLTNRQVTDLLNADPQRKIDRFVFTLEQVKGVRCVHRVDHNKQPRDRGLAAKIRAAKGVKSWKKLQSELNCSKGYIQRIWREMDKAGD